MVCLPTLRCRTGCDDPGKVPLRGTCCRRRVLARNEVAETLRPGTHASTFGGNPLAARAGLAAIEMIEQQDLLQRGTWIGDFFRAEMERLAQDSSLIRDIRIAGTMIGVELDVDATPLVQKCMERKLLVNCTQQNVLRLLPALVLTNAEAEQGMEILREEILAAEG